MCSTPGNLHMQSSIWGHHSFHLNHKPTNPKDSVGKRSGKGNLKGNHPGNRKGPVSPMEWDWQHGRGDLTKKTHCKRSRALFGECTTCKGILGAPQEQPQNQKGWKRPLRSHPAISTSTNPCPQVPRSKCLSSDA